MQMMGVDEYARKLFEAYTAYSFPTVTYDFDANAEQSHCDMIGVERYIQDRLTSGDPKEIKDGLSNVLYWGWARSELQCRRVDNFRKEITPCKLNQFAEVISELSGGSPGLVRLKGINMPEFGYMSFVSKIRMFLDPANYPVLDTKLAEAFSQRDKFPPLRDLKYGEQENAIRISGPNERVYGKWASWCSEIARLVNATSIHLHHFRAVDVERAIFHLNDSGHTSEAWQLLLGLDSHIA